MMKDRCQNKFKVYIYGAGHYYNRLSSYLRRESDQLEVLGVVTSQPMFFEKIDGYKVIRPEEMNMSQADYVIIAVKEWKEVAAKLYELGVKEEEIIRSSVFELPWFDLEEYLKLRKSNITILANNCMAGVVYKELGLKALSPTINLTIRGDCCLEFFQNSEYYLNKEAVVYRMEEAPVFVPKAIIDEKIVINFVHSDNAETGVKKWNERRQRANFDNIAITMVLSSDAQAYAFEQLPISKKIGVYYKDLGLKSVIYLPEWEDEKLRLKEGHNFGSYSIKALTNSFGRVGRIDWIKFLNGEEDYLRY